MFSQFINSTFIFIFLLANLSSTSAWGISMFGSGPTSATPETENFVHNSEPKLNVEKDSGVDTKKEVPYPTTASTSPATTPSFNASSLPEETRNLTNLLDESSNTTPTEPPTTTPTEPATTITTTPTTSTTTSTTTSAPEIDRPQPDENDFSDFNEPSDSKKNESRGNNHSFRSVTNAPDNYSSTSNTNSSSESDNENFVPTTPKLQGNESVSANISILDNSNKTTTTERPGSEDVLSKESRARENSQRSAGDQKEDDKGYTPVLPVNETVTTENVTSSVTTISPSTGSPKDLIESVGRRVNRNSANSIGSNQLLPILFTLLISLIF